MRTRTAGWIAVGLVAIASARIIATYKPLSHTTDEPAHLAAGIEWLDNGTYTYEDQHPPLARVVGALGARATGARWSRHKDIYEEGYSLLAQGGHYTRTLFYSRLATLPFFWIAAVSVYLWALRISEPRAALFALLLFTTTPPVLAHSGLATTDMALCAFVSASLLAMLWWMDRPGVWRSLVFGLLTGLAILSKFSALVFLPAVWTILAFVHRDKWRSFPFRWLPAVMAPLLAVVCGMYRLRLDIFVSGIRHVALHNSIGHLAYLLGKRSQTGFWYYYPVVLAVKTPLAMLFLWAIALRFARRLAAPLALIAAVLAIGALTHINIGVRHILPVFTGLAICGGVAVDYLARSGRSPAWFGVALLAWQCGSGIFFHPDYIAYTNELAGRHPDRILADSDLDWNQGMKGLTDRLNELGVHELTFKLASSSYMVASGRAFPAYHLMPDGDKPNPGWNAVSVTEWKLTGEPKWAEQAEPTERVRRSIYLYYFNPKSPTPASGPVPHH